MIARHPNQLGESRFELLESQFEVGFGFTDVTGKDEPVPRMMRNLQQCPSVGFISQVKIAYRVQFHAGYLSLWRWNARYWSFAEQNAGHDATRPRGNPKLEVPPSPSGPLPEHSARPWTGPNAPAQSISSGCVARAMIADIRSGNYDGGKHYERRTADRRARLRPRHPRP